MGHSGEAALKAGNRINPIPRVLRPIADDVDSGDPTPFNRQSQRMCRAYAAIDGSDVAAHIISEAVRPAGYASRMARGG